MAGKGKRPWASWVGGQAQPLYSPTWTAQDLPERHHQAQVDNLVSVSPGCCLPAVWLWISGTLVRCVPLLGLSHTGMDEVTLTSAWRINIIHLNKSLFTQQISPL